MRALALFVALFTMVIGLAGIVTPDSLLTVGRNILTPTGLYAIAALRVGIGLLLMMVAGSSRAPRALRVVGAFVLVAGLVTPLFGVERSRAILEWEAAQGTALVRVVAVLVAAIGGFVAYAVAPRRSPN